MPRIQLQLAAALVGLVVLVTVAFGALAVRSLERHELRRVASSLEARGRLVEELLRGHALAAGPGPELDAIADLAGPAASARVTLIDAAGTVVGDSDVPLEKLPAIENHAGRPEVQEALAGHVGTSTRRSATVGRPLFYLAIPVETGGVLRLAIDLSELDSAIADLRWELATAGGIGLVAALALSYLIASTTMRPLRELQSVARSVAKGDLETRVPLRVPQDLAELSSAIDRMAQQLRERLLEATREKEQLRAVLDGMVEGVLVVDAGGRIILANERLREFYDVSSDVVGRTPLEVLRDAPLDDVLARASETDEPVSAQIPGGPRGGRTFGVHAVRFPAGSGPRTGTVAVLHDVTESARLDQMRRDFVANASHELRTPLAAVRGFAETLLGSPEISGQDQRSYLEIIDRHARRLCLLIDDLLELSRIESGEADQHAGRVDLAAVAEGWLRDAATRIADRGLEVSRVVDGPTVAWADRRAVEQVIGNLLENALRYTEPGGRIEVRVSAAGRVVRLDVQDTGIGIPKGDLDRIFERFYRVDKARSRALGGTGLGLSIVKHLVHHAGGSVHVESELGQGSTFRVLLPAAPS